MGSPSRLLGAEVAQPSFHSGWEGSAMTARQGGTSIADGLEARLQSLQLAPSPLSALPPPPATPDVVSASASMDSSAHHERPAQLPPQQQQQQQQQGGGGRRGQQGGSRRNQDKVRRTVYISDIAHDITEAQLAAFFADVGRLVDCRICGDPNSSMRFAFIEFLTEESARKALGKTGSLLSQYPIRVSLSKTAIVPVNNSFLPASEGERSAVARTIYVANVDRVMERDTVRAFFENTCGPVCKLRLLGDAQHNTKIAFIEFESAESAKVALRCSGGLLGTLPLRISPSKTPVRLESRRNGAQQLGGGRMGASDALAAGLHTPGGLEGATAAGLMTPGTFPGMLLPMAGLGLQPSLQMPYQQHAAQLGGALHAPSLPQASLGGQQSQHAHLQLQMLLLQQQQQLGLHHPPQSLDY